MSVPSAIEVDEGVQVAAGRHRGQAVVEDLDGAALPPADGLGHLDGARHGHGPQT